MNRADIVAVIRQADTIYHDPQVCIIHDIHVPKNCLAFTDRICKVHGAECQSWKTGLVHKGCVLKYDDGKYRRFEEDEANV